MLHNKLICPRCAARGSDLYECFDKISVICRKCKTKTLILKLRCAVEKATTPDFLNTRKGYNKYIVPSISEQRDAEARIDEMRGRKPGILPPDIMSPRVKDTCYSNYVKDVCVKPPKDDEEIIDL